MKWLAFAVLVLMPSAAMAGTAVGNGGGYAIPSFYATTAGGSNTAGVSNAYGVMTCNTGNVNCSAGVLSFTVGTSLGPNRLWLINAYQTASVVQLSSETLNLCMASLAATNGTVLEASWSQGGSVCNNALSNRFSGSGAFGNNALAGPNLSAVATGRFTVKDGTAVSMSCNGAGSTATVITYFGMCSMYAVSY